MTTSYWGVRVGPGGQYARVGRDGGFVAVAWDKLGDLTWVAEARDEKSAREQLIAAYGKAEGVSGVKASIGAGQLWRFAREIRDGDIVLTPNRAEEVVHIGRVKGAFRYVEKPTDACPYRQRRDVEWLLDVPRRGVPQPLLNSLGSLVTVFSVAKNADSVRSLLGEEVGQVHTPSKAQVDVLDHVVMRLLSLHPQKFEEFVADYFEAIGYDAFSTVYSGDGGIDVSGALDAEGLAQVLLRVQVKRSKAQVGIEVVLKTRGALAVDEQGAVITLGGYTLKAREEAEAPGKKRIILVDGESFVEMLLERFQDLSHDAQALLGVAPKPELPARERFTVVAEAPG